MKTIIKNGNCIIEKRKFVCLKCGCEFEATIDEFDVLSATDCPQCNTQIFWADGKNTSNATNSRESKEKERIKEILYGYQGEEDNSPLIKWDAVYRTMKIWYEYAWDMKPPYNSINDLKAEAEKLLNSALECAYKNEHADNSDEYEYVVGKHDGKEYTEFQGYTASGIFEAYAHIYYVDGKYDETIINLKVNIDSDNEF